MLDYVVELRLNHQDNYKSDHIPWKLDPVEVPGCLPFTKTSRKFEWNGIRGTILVGRKHVFLTDTPKFPNGQMRSTCLFLQALCLS